MIDKTVIIVLIMLKSLNNERNDIIEKKIRNIVTMIAK